MNESNLMGNVLGEMMNAASIGDTNKSKIVMKELDLLIPSDKNNVPCEDIEGLAENIRMNGLLQPIVINKDGVILCGHRRVQAMKLLSERNALYQFLGRELIGEAPCLISQATDEMEFMKSLIAANSYRSLEHDQKMRVIKDALKIWNMEEERGIHHIGRKREWIASLTGFSARSIQDFLTEIDQDQPEDESTSGSDAEFDEEYVDDMIWEAVTMLADPSCLHNKMTVKELKDACGASRYHNYNDPKKKFVFGATATPENLKIVSKDNKMHSFTWKQVCRTVKDRAETRFDYPKIWKKAKENLLLLAEDIQAADVKENMQDLIDYIDQLYSE